MKLRKILEKQGNNVSEKVEKTWVNNVLHQKFLQGLVFSSFFLKKKVLKIIGFDLTQANGR